MPTEVQRLLEEYTDAYLAFYPASASRLGLHQFDGQIGDFSPEAIATRLRALEEYKQRLATIDRTRLTPQEALDLALVERSLHSEQFDWSELRDHERNPLTFNYLLDVTDYIKRNYAPLPERVQALIAHLEEVPELLAQIRGHLGDRQIARPFVETALDVYPGYISLYEENLPAALTALQDRPLYEHFLRANDAAATAVRAFVHWLEGEALPAASDDFAIGAERYRRMLATGELLDLPLERLVQIGEEELRRNTAALRDVIEQIDPSRSPGEIVRALSKEHPDEQSLIADTRRMLEELRAFLVERNLVTIPTEIRPFVEETPPFARWAFAMMDTAGPFEDVATESFYYVTPPEQRWSAEMKEEWLSKFDYHTLKNMSIHEAYPGHYVHFLHVKTAPSRPARIFTSYSFVEGWAHYAEEMMVEEGVDARPQFRLAQLLDALIRNVRYLVAIQMHAGAMSVAAAARMFREHAFMEELPAHKEAVRGTFDPGYLNYTLGKFMMRRLRADYAAEQGADFSLRRFHDAVLTLGAPPIPLARRALLRRPAGDVL